MLRYTLYRILLAIPLLFGLSLLVFAYVRIIPGDPVTAMLGVQANPELVARLKAQYGFDKPIVDSTSVARAASPTATSASRSGRGQAVAPLIIDRIPATFQLMLGSLFVSLVVAIPVGITAGMRYRSRLDARHLHDHAGRARLARLLARDDPDGVLLAHAEVAAIAGVHAVRDRTRSRASGYMILPCLALGLVARRS